MKTFISQFFIMLGLITLLIGSELYVADKHFSMYESKYESLPNEEKEKFSEFYISRLNTNFHGFFAKFLGFPKNSDLQQKYIKNQ